MAQQTSIRLPLNIPTNGVAFPDGNNGGTWNTMYQVPFTTCYMYALPSLAPNQTSNTPGVLNFNTGSAVLLGGIQSWRPAESAPTQDLYQSGTDFIEFLMQPRVWTVNCTRAIPRGAELRVLMRQIYGYVQDVDFRQLPVVLQMSYDQSDPSGNNTVETATWTWALGTFQNVAGPYWGGPYGALMEDWDFKGRGIAYVGGNTSYNNLEAYWGTSPQT